MSKERPRLAFLRETYLPLFEKDVDKIEEAWHLVKLMPEATGHARARRALMIFEALVKADPDQETHKNTQTLLNWALRGAVQSSRLFYVTEDLKFFMRVRDKADFEGSCNIATYRSPEQLANVLAPYRSIFMRSTYMKECDEHYLESHGHDGARILFESSDFRILRLLSKEATKAYTRKMRCCLAYDRTHDDFEDYQDDLMMLQNGGGRRWLISFGQNQWRDENDIGVNINLPRVIGHKPVVLEVLRPYLHDAIVEFATVAMPDSMAQLVTLCMDMPILQDDFTHNIPHIIRSGNPKGVIDFIGNAGRIPDWRDAISTMDIVSIMDRLKGRKLVDLENIDGMTAVIDMHKDKAPHWQEGLKLWNKGQRRRKIPGLFLNP